MAGRVYCMKVAVLGDQAVGKTCAVRAFSGLAFEQEYHETREVKIWDCLLPAGGALEGGQPSPAGDHGDDADAGGPAAVTVRAQFWDCGARALDETRLQRVLDGALCTLLVYDVTDLQSYRSATTRWYECARALAPDSFVVLVGCKTDQVKCRAVSVKQIEAFASANSLFFMELSARASTNVDLTLSLLRIRAKHAMNSETAEDWDSDDLGLTDGELGRGEDQLWLGKRSGLGLHDPHGSQVPSCAVSTNSSTPIAAISLERDSAPAQGRGQRQSRLLSSANGPHGRAANPAGGPAGGNSRGRDPRQASRDGERRSRRGSSASACERLSQTSTAAWRARTEDAASQASSRAPRGAPSAGPQDRAQRSRQSRSASVASRVSFSRGATALNGTDGRAGHDHDDHHDAADGDHAKAALRQGEPPAGGSPRDSGLTISTILGRPARVSPNPALGEGEGDVDAAEYAFPVGGAELAANGARGNGGNSPFLQGAANGEFSPHFEEVRDPAPASMPRTAQQAASQKEYELLTRIIRDAMYDDTVSPTSGGARSEPGGLSQDGWKTVTVQPGGLLTGDGENASQYTVPAGQGVTKMRIHRSGSISVATGNSGAGLRLSRHGDKLSPVTLDARANSDVEDDNENGENRNGQARSGGPPLAFHWNDSHKTWSVSDGETARSIKPSNLTLHNRPTLSYLRKLEEDETARSQSGKSGPAPAGSVAGGGSVADGMADPRADDHRERLGRAGSLASTVAPDLFVDVIMGGEQLGTIAVREADNPAQLALEFVRKHSLPASATEKLTRMLRRRVNEFYEEETTRASVNQRMQAREEQRRQRKAMQNVRAPKLGERRADASLPLSERPILGTLHVKVGKGRIGKLVVRDGDDPKELVGNFKKTFGLKPRQAAQIEQRIIMQLQLEVERKEQQERQKQQQLQQNRLRVRSEKQGPDRAVESRQRPGEEYHEEDGLEHGARGAHEAFLRPAPLDVAAATAAAAKNSGEDKAPSPLRYPSVLTQAQRDLLHATLGWSQHNLDFGDANGSENHGGGDTANGGGAHGNHQAAFDDGEDDDGYQTSAKPSPDEREFHDRAGFGASQSPRQNAKPEVSGWAKAKSEVVPPMPPRAPPPVPSEQLFHLDVNLGSGRTERITVCQGDDLAILAQDFCFRHQLTTEKVSRVQFLLEEKLVHHHTLGTSAT